MPARPSPSLALVLINNRPLQRTAWAALHTARKRLEKASRDLRRHEETDTSAYQAWLHGTFPVPVTTLRELNQEVSLKAHQVQSVQMMAVLTGRSLKKLWREYLDELANPQPFQPDPEPETDRESDPEADDDRASDEHPPRSQRSSQHDFFDDSDDEAAYRQPPRPALSAARDTYRRLVQHLHPDRGGEWTAAREHLWHEVQRAWDARDADWLARLEIDWDAAHDTLHPDSSVSRLRRALSGILAAHRDIEHKLRDYRASFAWRFTLNEKKRAKLHDRVEADLRHEIASLQRQLAHLNATIAAWESPLPGRRR